jgi:hypothetical protein
MGEGTLDIGRWEMKTLKIKAGPGSKGSIKGRSMVAIGPYCNITMLDDDGKEIDLTGSVRNVVVDIPIDDVITAKVEFYVEELDLEGVKVNE